VVESILSSLEFDGVLNLLAAETATPAGTASGPSLIFLFFQTAIGAEVVPGNSRWRTQIGTSILTTDGSRVKADRDIGKSEHRDCKQCRGTGDPGIGRSATELHRRSPPHPATGIAPATSRLTGEVTRIFTTGKIKTIPYRGTTEQSIFETAVLD